MSRAPGIASAGMGIPGNLINNPNPFANMHKQDDDYGSTVERGELKFSGFRETVDFRSPDREAMAAEIIKATDAREQAYERLQTALSRGVSQVRIEHLERLYAKAQERVRELESCGEDDWQASEAKALSMAGALGRGMSDERQAQRLEDFRVFLMFCAQGGISNPWQMFKNFLGICRRVAPELVGNVTATEMAAILGETKGAVSDREIRIVEEIQKRWGVKGYHGYGGSKGEDSRAAFSVAAKGNDNRRKGAKAAHRRKVIEAAAKPEPKPKSKPEPKAKKKRVSARPITGDEARRMRIAGAAKPWSCNDSPPLFPPVAGQENK